MPAFLLTHSGGDIDSTDECVVIARNLKHALPVLMKKAVARVRKDSGREFMVLNFIPTTSGYDYKGCFPVVEGDPLDKKASSEAPEFYDESFAVTTVRVIKA